MTYLIVGLGNPGEQYERTRHNTGFLVLNTLVDDDWKKDAVADGISVKGKIGKHAVYFLQPHTMMNKSGSAVVKLALKQKIKPENIIVVHDDIDLPVGKVRIVKGRGSGGHNGVESVRKALKTKDFIRVRVGVSSHTPTGKIRKPKGEKKVLEYLLGTFTKKDEVELKKALKCASEAVESIVAEGLVSAMNAFN